MAFDGNWFCPHQFSIHIHGNRWLEKSIINSTNDILFHICDPVSIWMGGCSNISSINYSGSNFSWKPADIFNIEKVRKLIWIHFTLRKEYSEGCIFRNLWLMKLYSSQILCYCNVNNSRLLFIMGTDWQWSTEHQPEWCTGSPLCRYDNSWCHRAHNRRQAFFENRCCCQLDCVRSRLLINDEGGTSPKLSKK